MQKNLLVSLLLTYSLFVSPVFALQFEDQDLKEGQTLNPIKLNEALEVHGDLVLTNDWTDGAHSPEGRNEHRSYFDYRLETHLALYNLKQQQGRLITRIQGYGFIDENIDTMMDDQLIDIPELFFQNESKYQDNDLRFVFGKFTNRRFFNKDEINPDPFDIGEMRFSGAIANTSNHLSGVNEFRDPDHRVIGSRQATGSYGFNFGIKNQNMNGGLASRWGLEQAFAVAQMDDFSGNFYGISEINKNWGDKRAGKLRAGYLYANDKVFRQANNEGNSHLFYSSLAQKFTSKLKGYARYSVLNRDLSTGQSSSHEYRLGVYRKWNSKLGSHHWLGYFDGDDNLAEHNNFLQQVNVFTYKITDQFISHFATVFRFNQFNAETSDLEDSNYTLALQLKYFF